MLTETDMLKYTANDKTCLVNSIALNIKQAEHLIAEDKTCQAFFHIAAGQHIIESSLAELYTKAVAADILTEKYIYFLDLAAELAAKLSLMCGVISCGYDEEEQLNNAIELWQKLYKKTGNSKYKDKRAALIAQHFACPQKPPDTKKLLAPFNSARILEQYDILGNDDDDILITIPQKIYLKGEENTPTFYYDGAEHGILFINNASIAICDYININARASLLKLPQVLIFELHEPVTQYMAQVVAAPACGALIQKIYKHAVRAL